MSILVVGDDERISTYIARALEESGFQTAVAQGAWEALEFVRGSWPALVVLDLGFHHPDGLEVLRSLRRAGVDAPVVVIAACSRREAARAGLTLGEPAGYLEKPFHLAELVEVVNARLRQHLRT